MAFRLLTSAGDVSFAHRNIAPPGDRYITRDDQVAITSWNSVAGVALQLRARLLTPDGKVRISSFAHVPNTDRSAKSEAFALAEGFLLGVMVVVTAGTVLRGQCFVSVFLTLGSLPITVAGQLLAQDYVTGSAPIAWPGTPIRSPTEGPGFSRTILGTDPAPGNVVLETVPTNARWRLLWLRASLTTDATVVNRVVRLNTLRAGPETLSTDSHVNQPASTTFRYVFGPYGAWQSSTQAPSPTQHVAMPSTPTLEPGDQISVFEAQGFTVADDFTAPRYYVEEWISI
jgi:hypothetical protein